MNPYDILGIEKTASDEEIKSAYRKLAFTHHPDRNPGNKEAETRFKNIQAAYEVLSNPLKRREYDNSDFTPFNTFWERVYTRNPTSIIKGRDVHADLEIDLEDVLTGSEREINVPSFVNCTACDGAGGELGNCAKCNGKGVFNVTLSPAIIQMRCSECNGTGKAITKLCETCNGSKNLVSENKTISLKIPPGIHNGVKFKVAGMGEASKGVPNGNLYVSVWVKEHPVFTVDDLNLVVEVPVTYTQLVLGDKIKVPTLDGKELDLEIPPKTKYSSPFVFKSHGLPLLNNIEKKGSLVAILRLEIPRRITKKHREILQELAKIEKGE